MARVIFDCDLQRFDSISQPINTRRLYTACLYGTVICMVPIQRMKRRL